MSEYKHFILKCSNFNCRACYGALIEQDGFIIYYPPICSNGTPTCNFCGKLACQCGGEH